MSDPMAEIRDSFFLECEELLESLFDALQAMSDGESDAETINIAFRAVHSIKGGAGAFALDDLVDFAHHFETVMDHLRDGRLVLAPDLVDLFFKCGDILSDLVKTARDGEETDSGSIKPVVDALKEASGGLDTDSTGEDEAVDFQPMTLDFGSLDDLGMDDLDFEMDLPEIDPIPTGIDTPDNGHLTVYFKPEPDLYRSGNEPLFLLRSLSELGPCNVTIEFNPTSSMPSSIDHESRLAWYVDIETPASRGAIEEIFEFVSGLCILEITGDTPVPESDAPNTADDEPREIAVDHAPSETQNDASMPVTPAPAKEKEPSKTQAAVANPTVRVDLGRIDRLVNLVGELVINQAMLSQSVAEAGIAANTDVSNGLDEFLQLTRDIQESVMMIRAQPVKSLFQRMSRIVREASAAVDKKVTLATEGESTEIDKTVIERLSDPLTHMIRNAVDHGLESKADRTAAGKPENGTVRLSAMHRSGRVVIEISDDGGGINRAKVRQIAVDKALIPEDAQLADSEIDQLLFLPGFSTAEKISNLSGRGVGMDVVKNAITALGGRITIKSEPGVGTTFSISLPLTLAVLDGMVVTVAGETLVMPLSVIGETLTLKSDDVRRLGPKTSVAMVRDTFVPLLDLGAELGYRAPLSEYSGAIALLVGQEDGDKAALVVDAIDDQRQVVIKGLQESYGRVSGVAAATILGDGQIALILDAADLVQNAVRSGAKAKILEASDNG